MNLITISLPIALADIAAKIGRALDPDTGGADSFQARENGTVVCITPCSADFSAKARALAINAALLQKACADDYARRWPALIPPTLSECQQFCAAVVIT